MLRILICIITVAIREKVVSTASVQVQSSLGTGQADAPTQSNWVVQKTSSLMNVQDQSSGQCDGIGVKGHRPYFTRRGLLNIEPSL